MSAILERVVGVVDERLPLHAFIEVSRRQAEVMPLEIVEQGRVYEVFDCKMHIEGYQNIMTAFYQMKKETE